MSAILLANFSDLLVVLSCLDRSHVREVILLLYGIMWVGYVGLHKASTSEVGIRLKVRLLGQK